MNIAPYRETLQEREDNYKVGSRVTRQRGTLQGMGEHLNLERFILGWGGISKVSKYEYCS